MSSDLGLAVAARLGDSAARPAVTLEEATAGYLTARDSADDEFGVRAPRRLQAEVQLRLRTAR